jgi:hypothetical protein
MKQIKYRDFERNSGFWVNRTYTLYFMYKKGQTIPVTDHGDPQRCEMFRFPNFLHNQLIDGSEAVSLMRQLSFTLGKIQVTNFC